MMQKSLCTIAVFLVLGLVLSIYLTGCWRRNYFLRIRPTVVNLEELNTKYDEFNTAAPPFYYSDLDFVFSTNAHSEGGEYDIQYTKSYLRMDWDDDLDKEKTDKHTFEFEVKKGATPFLEEVSNSESNEYGPYIIHAEDEGFQLEDNYEGLEEEIFYFVASDRKGEQFDIYYKKGSEELKAFPGNSPKDNDYYLTYHRESNTLYYCSDRGDSYNIYSYRDETASELEALLDIEVEPKPVEKLNSSGNDKTPYILGDVMVFVSDRDSAEGNFDIYFSKFENRSWSEPEKLPQNIDSETDDSFHYLNSQHNEYRPILFEKRSKTEDVTNNLLMVFSSDRPGGKGGYDLYLAVLPLGIFN